MYLVPSAREVAVKCTVIPNQHCLQCCHWAVSCSPVDLDLEKGTSWLEEKQRPSDLEAVTFFSHQSPILFS